MAFWRFLQYHNAVPIAVSVALLGAGGVFAATNPEAIYSAEEHVLSIDNTYLANKDLSSYTPKIQIVGVTEDPEFYYVAYKFFTIDLQDYVWKDVTKDETMNVSKVDLGPFRDLGLYVTDQLKQIVDREMSRLAETQEMARRNVTPKVVATQYGGLVGKFLDTTTEELPGYTPVVEPPAPPPSVAAAASSDVTSPAPPPEAAPSSGSELSGDSSDTIPPAIQVLGNNPAEINVGVTYADLGAVATDNVNGAVSIRVFLNGKEVSAVSIDTSSPGEWVVRYEAKDAAGNVGWTERKVIVSNPFAPQVPAPAATSTESSASSTPAQPEPTPPSAPEQTSPPPPPEPALSASSTTPAPDPTPTPPSPESSL